MVGAYKSTYPPPILANDITFVKWYVKEICLISVIVVDTYTRL